MDAMGGGWRNWLAWAVLLASLALWRDGAMALEILSPRGGVAVTGDVVILIGFGANSSRVEWETVGETGRRQGAAKALSSGGFGGAVSLFPGRNRLRVGPREVEVFSVQEGAGAADGFRPLRVHSDDISNCRDCHQSDLAVRGGGYPGVCLNCHVVEAQNPEFVGVAADDRHFASAGAKCGKCHDPHGSADPKLLLGSSQELCGACHGRREDGAEAHPAYEEQGCMACHAPHFSGYANQLSGTLPGVCQECHEQGTGASAHEPVTDAVSCSNCHDVHGANGTMTPVSVPGLCIRCHAGVLDGGHGAELEDCLGCHDPHGDGGRVLATVSETCSECHDGVAD
ncbi:MAG: cytochrome c3 family protein, partial [Deferrisomatales bacterium]|nr:cytochrome c3 family protein [Deferrisomatales bacterium]